MHTDNVVIILVVRFIQGWRMKTSRPKISESRRRFLRDASRTAVGVGEPRRSSDCNLCKVKQEKPLVSLFVHRVHYRVTISKKPACVAACAFRHVLTIR